MCKSLVPREKVSPSLKLECRASGSRAGAADTGLRVRAPRPGRACSRAGRLGFILSTSHTRLPPRCKGDVLVNDLFHTFSHRILATRFRIQIAHSCGAQKRTPPLPEVPFVNEDCCFFLIFLVLIFERERETQNLKQLQALSCQHRTLHGARTHKL